MAIEIRSLERSLMANLTWNKARIKLLARLLVAVVQTKTVNLAQLASVLQSTAMVESNYKRVQRFFRFFQMPYAELALLLVRLLAINQPFVLTLDRTEWQVGGLKFNLLVLAMAYRGAAIPLIFHVLPKVGTSSFQQRKAILAEFLEFFGAAAIDYLTADREFHGKRFYQYLDECGIRFCLRGRLDTPLTQAGKVRRLRALVSQQHLRVKYYWHARQLLWNVAVKVATVRLAADEWLIVIASPELEKDLFTAYAARWEIETCFGCLKARGFCLEATRLHKAERVKCLLGVLALCFCWAIKTGEWVVRKRPLRVSSHGRLAKSLFRTGFDWLRQILCSFTKSNDIVTYKDIVHFLSCT